MLYIHMYVSVARDAQVCKTLALLLHGCTDKKSVYHAQHSDLMVWHYLVHVKDDKL